MEAVFFQNVNSVRTETTTSKFTVAATVTEYGQRTKSLCYLFNEATVQFYPDVTMEVYNVTTLWWGTENEATGGQFHSTGNDFMIAFSDVPGTCKPESPPALRD